MIVSLDDQLEWQESSRSHSPKTPSAPEVLESLRKNSPPPTPSKGNIVLQSEVSLKELDNITGMEALQRFSENNLLRHSRMRGDSLFFPNGSMIPISLRLPLKVRVVIRPIEDGANKSSVSEVREDVDIGSVWLSLIAEYTYESQLASLLRSRKGLYEIAICDRRIINRYFSGALSMGALQMCGMWGPRMGPDVPDEASKELLFQGDDVISVRVRRRAQLDSLEERKTILKDQQNRLRKLLARELQRQHSSKPSNLASAQASLSAPVPVIQPVQTSPDVPEIVSEVLKLSKSSLTSEVIACIDSEQSSVLSDDKCNYPKSAESDLIATKSRLKSFLTEMYRVNSRLNEARENQIATERRVKRLKYEVQKGLNESLPVGLNVRRC